MKKIIKLRLTLINLILILNFIYSANYLNYFKVDEDIGKVSKVLHDVAVEFFDKENIKFNILIINEMSNFSLEVLRNFMEMLNGRFSFKILLHKMNKINYEVQFVNGSYIIFIESILNFYDIEIGYEVVRHNDEPMKFLIFIPNFTFDQFQTSKIIKSNDKINMESGEVFHHSYFITNEMDTLTLSTVEWFSPYGCNSPHLNKLNTFHKETMEWKSNLENYEKFLDYHGCELVMMLPSSDSDGTLNYVSGYAYPKTDEFESFEVHGITPVIFKIAVNYHNFSVYYQPVLLPPYWIFTYATMPYQGYLINNTFKEPLVFFHILSLHTLDDGLRGSDVVANLEAYMFVTPAEKYTPYEKFFLPFDLWIWSFLCLTFALTFLSIFIINCFSKSVQNLVYGHKVDTPIWNIVCIFFGISQMKLPNSNFSRSIWIMFIYFCLIFRTCFQSKFFEFMTSESRQSPPKTIDDVIDMQYNVYAMVGNEELSSNVFHSGRW